MEGMQRRVGLVLVAVGVILLATATYGFGSIVADRSVNVGVSSDNGAYLGIEETGAQEVNVSTTPAPAVLDLTNNFESDLTQVTVEVSSTDGSTVLADDLEATGPSTLGTTEGTKSVSLQCADASDAEEDNVRVTIDITASGSGVSVDTSEAVTIDVDCNEQSS
jgi:hypothetical protein